MTTSTITLVQPTQPTQDLILRLGDDQIKRNKILTAFKEKKLPILLKSLSNIDEDTVKLMNEIISNKDDKDHNTLISILNARNDSIAEMNKLKDIVGESVIEIFQSILVNISRLSMENTMLQSGIVDAQCTIEEKDREITHLTQTLNKLKAMITDLNNVDLSIIDEWDKQFNESEKQVIDIRGTYTGNILRRMRRK